MTMTGSCVRAARKPLRISTCSSTVDKKEAGILAQLAPLPKIPSTAPGPPTIHPAAIHYKDFPMPLTQVTKAMKGTPTLPQFRSALNSWPQSRSTIFHCLATIWFWLCTS